MPEFLEAASLSGRGDPRPLIAIGALLALGWFLSPLITHVIDYLRNKFK